MMELRDYQIEIAGQAYDLLRKFHITYLCMEVRTGKTFTAFEAARLYGARRVLFVTKLKAISSIKKDFEGSGKHFSLYVTNYDQLKKVESGWDLVIIDEAHSIGAFPKPSLRAKELKRICVDTPIIYLSGTPTPESLSQVYHQFWVSSYSPWSQYKTFYAWHKDFGIEASKFIYNRRIADYSKVTADVQPVFDNLKISYTQQQAGFEALVEEEIIWLPMSGKIAWAVKKLRKEKIFTTKDGHTVLADTAVKEMQKVHQCCSGTVKSEDGDAIVFDNSKALLIKERFSGKRIAIFYKYIAEGHQLRYDFAGKIYEDPMAFNKSEGEAVFISQIQSGREGLNLSTADALVMYNIDFSATSYWQARARIQTLDRTEPAKVYWVFTRGGIEEKIYEMVCKKKDFTTQHYKRLLM